jgi:hypothetical protein
LNASISRPLYQGQPIKQDTSEVFRTEEPEACVLVVNTVHGTLLCLMAGTNADRVAGEQWTTDEHLEDVFTRRANGSLLSLEDFIAGPIDHSINPDGTIEIQDIQAAADEQHYTPTEVAQMLKVSSDTILRKFADYPGVIDLGAPEKGSKRRYRVLRIPHSVLEKFLIDMQVT